MDTMNSKSKMGPEASLDLRHYYLMGQLNAVPNIWLLITASIWIIFEFIWLGKYSPFIAGDNVSFVPYYLAFTENDIAFSNWTPFPAGGTDFAATGYSTLFFKGMFYLLPSWAAFQVFLFIPIVFAFIGIYGICIKTIKLDKVSSLFAAFSYVIMFFQQLFFASSAVAYIPAIIYALSNLLESKNSVKWWSLSILPLILIVESSVISRVIPWTSIVIVVWFLVIDLRTKWNDWAIILFLSFGLIIMSVFDIIAILSHINLSSLPEYRPATNFGTVLSRSSEAIYQHVSGRFFSSFIFLFLFGMHLYHNRTPIGFRTLYALGIFICLLLIASFSKLFFPEFNSFNVIRIMQGFDIFVVIAGGFGLRYLLQITKYQSNLNVIPKVVIRMLPLTLFLFVICINLNTKIDHAKAWMSWGNLIQNSRSPDLVELANNMRADGVPSRAMSFYMHGPLLNSYGIETIESYHPVTLKRYYEFWRLLAKPYLAALDSATVDGWPSHGFDGITTSILRSKQISRSHGQTKISGKRNLEKFVNMSLLSLANVKFVISREKLIGKGMDLISGPDRSWPTLSLVEKIETNIKANFSGEKPIYIYRNRFALPRAYTVNKVKGFLSDKRLLDALSESRMNVLSNSLFFNMETVPDVIKKNLSSFGLTEIKEQSFKNDKITIKLASAKHPTVLIVVNSFSPYWKVKIDDVPAKLFPANYAFWGVFVPPNSETIEFSYQPPYLL